MLGGHVAFRFAATGAHRSTRLGNALPVRLIASNASRAPHLTPASVYTFNRRNYATPGKPKKGSIGESAARRTRKPRDQTAKPSDTTVVRTRANKVASTATAEEKKAARTKEREAKKAALAKEKAQTKEKALKAAQLKKKASLKAKQDAAKEREAKRKAALKAKQDGDPKAQIRALKALALDPPPLGSISAWSVYFSEKGKSSTAAPGSPERSDIARTAATEYKQLGPAELEHYNHIANERLAKRQQIYKTWIEARTPSEIHSANLARGKLRKLVATRRGKYSPIKRDARLVRPATAYFLFSKERMDSGDFKHVAVPAATRLITEEWKALDSSERQRYVSQYTEARKQYEIRYLELYGVEPGRKPKAKATSKSSTTTDASA